MGLCGSIITEEQKAALFRSKRIEEDAANDWEVEQSKVRLLLLGLF